MPKKKILLVDDEEDLTRLMKLSLEATGEFDVRSQTDPSKALKAAREFRPDLMILDLIMSGMDGGELMMQIKGDPELRNVPVAFLTASITTGSADSPPTLFGQPCLMKPVSIEDVLELIDACLVTGSEKAR